MKTASQIFAGCFLLATSVASAQSIEGVTMTSDPNDVVFTLRADKALSAPSVKTYEGSIRVRFPDSSAPTSITNPGDGAAIKLIDLRSGSHSSSVMRLEFGDNSKLREDDVRIENRKTSVVVRIARDLLPPLREPRSALASAEPAKKAEAPLAQLPASAAAPAAAVSSDKPAAKPSAAPLALAQKAAATPAKKKGEPLASSMANTNSPMPMLLAVSAILALAYGAMRLLMKKQSQAPRSAAPIDIVAQKRIGPRHQLVIVRAFGREHLLSIQGGTTTPIATSDEIDDSFGDKLAARMEPDAELVKDVAISQRATEPESKSESNLGGAMIRAALAQRLSATSKRVKAADAEGDLAPNGKHKEDKALSQAVAGLVRLRREAQS
jgi:flagellar biogenesis protein FliO